MNTTLSTRKPVEDLSAADLEIFPVWEFVSDDGNQSDDEDETWVRPVASPSIPDEAASLCIAVAARLSGGLIYPAVLFGDAAQGLEVNGIALLTTRGRVLFHVSDSPQETRLALRRLGLSQDQVLPLEFATRAPLSSTGQLVFGWFDG